MAPWRRRRPEHVRREGDVVVALRFDEPAVADELASWCSGEVERTPDADDPSAVRTTVWVPTATGPRPALLGDWIVRRDEHDFEPQTPEEFTATHEPLEQ